MNGNRLKREDDGEKDEVNNFRGQSSEVIAKSISAL